MRRKSAIDTAKQEARIRRARMMTPEERVRACITMSQVVAEIAQAGKRDREKNTRPSRP